MQCVHWYLTRVSSIVAAVGEGIGSHISQVKRYTTSPSNLHPNVDFALSTNASLATFAIQTAEVYQATLASREINTIEISSHGVRVKNTSGTPYRSHIANISRLLNAVMSSPLMSGPGTLKRSSLLLLLQWVWCLCIVCVRGSTAEADPAAPPSYASYKKMDRV